MWCRGWLCSLAVLLLLLAALSVEPSQALIGKGKGKGKEKSAVFLSPEFVLGPGSVVNSFYQDIDFPRGHIAVKSFDAEVVDDAGLPVPLHQTYLHHWVIERYYHRKGVEASKSSFINETHNPDFIMVRNSGICQNTLGQYFGLGSETRGTTTYVPDPYGIEVGNPDEIPDGYEEKWLLNVHAIDTRGVEDRLGCTECRCDLYNVTEDEHGYPLSSDYKGGLRCCYDKTQCRVRKGFEGARRSLYMRYTVKWVDWDSSVVPVKIYIFDVTDTWKRLSASTDQTASAKHNCLVRTSPCI